MTAAAPLRVRRVTAHVGLGSNLGDRRALLEGAVRGLEDLPATRVEQVSPWVETEPVGGPPGQPAFLNGVARVATRLAPRALLERLLALEVEAGRDRGREVRNGPRTLDLDLLLYGDETLDAPGLRVPHPRLEERAFVLEPLASVSPDVRLPSGRTAREAWERMRAGAAP